MSTAYSGINYFVFSSNGFCCCCKWLGTEETIRSTSARTRLLHTPASGSYLPKMENRAPKGQRASWRLSVGPRSGDRGAKKFSMAVILPNPGTEGTAPSVDCEFPIRATVGQIKVCLTLIALFCADTKLQNRRICLLMCQLCSICNDKTSFWH